MTETRPAASRNQTAALAGLLTIVILVSLSPLGTQFLFPMIGEVFVAAWNQLGVMSDWIRDNVLAAAVAWRLA